MLKIMLLRHGMTPGNKLSKYIGRTDESLSAEGVELLKQKIPALLKYEKPVRVFLSPMKRCQETAELFFPDSNEKRLVPELREFDFGIFENKNYRELDGCREYQEWVDGFCKGQVPEGENLEGFKKRCCEGLKKVLKECETEKLLSGMIAMVVHGGTIMSLMETYADQKKDYYEWSVKNGEGYLTEVDLEEWMDGKKILKVLSKLDFVELERCIERKSVII